MIRTIFLLLLFAAGQADSTPPPDFSSLDEAARAALTGLEPLWPGLSDADRERLLAAVSRLSALPEAERAQRIERWRHWLSLTPSQRAERRAAYERYRGLPAEQKQRIRRGYERWRALPEAERARLREEFAARRDELAGLILPGFDEGERSRLRQAVLDLPPEARKGLRARVLPLSSEERVRWLRDWLALAPEARSEALAETP